MKHIYFTVTNDLTYDQRMQRICTSLAENGFEVTLIGRKLPSSLPLFQYKYSQKRLFCFFKTGKLFYAEYNLRLLIFLFFKKIDCICAIDLDTIVPCYLISRIKNIPRVYDAHELFTELKEVITRPAIKKMWTRIEKHSVPKFRLGYTVSNGIAEEFKQRYGSEYEVIRNMPVLGSFTTVQSPGKFILYQGVVNEARAFEFLIPAMKKVEAKLVVCGDGNFMSQLKILVTQNGVENKVELKGMLTPADLWAVAQTAYIGIAVAESDGLNQHLALPNKFFDYILAGLPQVTMNYPEYKKLNDQYEVAILINDLNPETIASALNNLLQNDVLYRKLRDNCLRAREALNWKEEEKKLVRFYKTKVFTE